MGSSDLVRGESIADLVRGILSDLRMLIREEIALARAELRGHAGHVRAAAVSYAITALALVVGGVFILVAIAIAIAELLQWPTWAGFLIVALLLCVVGSVALASGRNRVKKAYSVPSGTVSTLKENAAWIARRMSSGRK